MSFLLSVNLFEDQWSFINLRDMLLLKTATIKEVRDTRKKSLLIRLPKKKTIYFL